VSTESVHHPVFARLYSWLAPRAEKSGIAEHRAEMLEGLRGRVIEVGAGNGLNFAHYGDGVTEVVAVEPEAYLRARAEEAASRAAVPVVVREGAASRLPASDGEFDAGVASLVLCSVPDQDAALAELRRVIRPGGELRFYEHVVSESPRHAALERMLDRRGIWPRVAGGCHLSRDTTEAIQRAGFAIDRLRRFRFKGGPGGLTHVIGVARRP
jgi:ubiquinone/menaquinone biosynthesis C-methylase UbiE